MLQTLQAGHLNEPGLHAFSRLSKAVIDYPHLSNTQVTSGLDRLIWYRAHSSSENAKDEFPQSAFIDS
jgi:hypothetical protein